MSPQDDVARGSTQSYAGEYELEFETPFLQTFATAYEGPDPPLAVCVNLSAR